MDTTPTPEAPIVDSDPTALRAIYLQRLQRLLQLRRQHEEELNPQGMRLLDHSVFAAYCDCRDVGAEQEAQAILREPRPPFERPAARPDPPGPQPRPQPAASPQASVRRARPQR